MFEPGDIRPTLEQWRAANPARQVPEWDFGSRWTLEEGGGHYRVSYVPDTGELYALDPDIGRVEVLATIDGRDVAAALDNWFAHTEEPGSLYWLRGQLGDWSRHHAKTRHPSSPTSTVAPTTADRGEPAAPSGPGGDGWVAPVVAISPEAALELRAGELDRREAAVAAAEQTVASPADGPDGTAVWSVPAAPVARVVADLAAGTGDPLPVVARGLGVEASWVEGVAAGAFSDVDIPHVQQICESLHCSPYDLWGKDDAQAILHAYGPELWPRFIEPLQPADDPPLPPIDDHDFDR